MIDIEVFNNLATIVLAGMVLYLIWIAYNDDI